MEYRQKETDRTRRLKSRNLIIFENLFMPWKGMIAVMNYFKMYGRFIIIYMKGKMEYHFSLLFELLANSILIGVYFAGFYVIFYNFDNIAGWNKYEVLFLFTTGWLSYSFSCFFFWSPMRDIGQLIRSGNFDLYLTRPIGPLIYLVLQQFQYTFFPRLIFSVIFWIYSMQKLQISWTAMTVFYYCVNLSAAFIIFSAITIITGTVSFWTIKSEEMISLLTNNDYGLKNFCDYPIEIYSKSVQWFLTFIIPYALTGYYPVSYILGKDFSHPWIAYISPCMALVMAFIACLFWKTGLKHYGGTGA